jgi:hypothetical protein
MKQPIFSFLILGALLMGGTGCAGLGQGGRSGSASANGSSNAMDQTRLEQIFSDQVEAITGPTGAIQTQVDGIPVYCISDPANDRMRLIAPIARVAGLDPRLHEVLLRANFHNSLDARYAISEDVFFATYLHPISSLTAEQIESALSQVVSLVKTFGTSFSSGEFEFPTPGNEEPSPQESSDEDANPTL